MSIDFHSLPEFRNPCIPYQYWDNEYSKSDVPYGVRIDRLVPFYVTEPVPAHTTRPIVMLDLETMEKKQMNAIETLKHFKAGAVLDVAGRVGVYKTRFLLYYLDQSHLVTDDLIERRKAEIVARKAFSH